MIYLGLAFCSSALISVIMRLGEGRIQNNISVLAVNYLACTLLSMVHCAGGGGIVVRASAGAVPLLLGLISGVFYMGSFVLYQYNIRRNGVLMSSTFMKLGVLVPATAAVIVFGERPGALQITGICLAIGAILIIGRQNNDEEKAAGAVTDPRALVFLLLAGGTGDAMSKVYEELGPPEFSSQYLLYTFASALFLCTVTVLIRGQKLSPPDAVFGLLVGIPNYYSARFLLMSLSYVPAVIAYPMFSVCTIVLTGAAGVLVFRERMTKGQWTAVGLIMAAMVLLNISG